MTRTIVQYLLPKSNLQSKVCKVFFANTLSIGHQVIWNMMNGTMVVPSRKVKPTSTAEVIFNDWLDMIPKMEIQRLIPIRIFIYFLRHRIRMETESMMLANHIPTRIITGSMILSNHISIRMEMVPTITTSPIRIRMETGFMMRTLPICSAAATATIGGRE